MKKIKQFFANIFTAIGHFFLKIWDFITYWLRKFFNTKPMRAIGNVIMFLPRKLDDRLNNQQRKSMWGIIFVIPLLVGFVYFFIIPFVLTIVYSFSYVEKFSNVPGLTTIFVGWNNYVYVFKDFTVAIDYVAYTFPELLVKALIEIITDLPVILIFSLIMAVVLNSKFAGRTLVRAIFFMPVIFNSQAVDLAIESRTAMSAIISQNTSKIFENMFSFKDFLMNANIPVVFVTFLGNASSKIYDIISYSGIQILIFLSAIQSVPRHLYEAAKMEGATQYEMFWKITFPMVSPMLLTTAVYTIVDSYTRSSFIKAITKFSDAKKSTTYVATGLTGKALDTYFHYNGVVYQADPDPITGEPIPVTEINQLTNYGIGAALSIMYSIMVILIIAIVLGILSKAVFYYDN
ncbi:MAG: sugar ABC transporter permease [Bacilli bacterium]|nr:sugar ABC transporter permease [Bacilli bacterium]